MRRNQDGLYARAIWVWAFISAFPSLLFVTLVTLPAGCAAAASFFVTSCDSVRFIGGQRPVDDARRLALGNDI